MNLEANDIYEQYIQQSTETSNGGEYHSDGHLDGDTSSIHTDEHADRPNN